jgi:hypothetical protein
MKNAKILISIALASLMILTQFAAVLAAPPLAKPAPVAGAVNSVSLATDPTTGVITVLVGVTDQMGEIQTVRVSGKTAAKLGLIDHDSADGNPFIVNPLPKYIEIDAKSILTDEQPRHPVGSALADFFDGIKGIDYEIIMGAHAACNGFGVIAQVLWLIEKMGGTADDFLLLLDAKKNNDFTDFPLDDGTIATSWGELKKALVDKHLGLIMSQKNKEGDGDGPQGNPNNPTGNDENNSNKDKTKDKTNHGSNDGQGQNQDNDHGNGNKP